MPTLRHMAGPAASRARAATSATAQTSGTNAEASVTVSPAAQAAPRARLADWDSTPPAGGETAGSGTKTPGGPTRPAGIGPMATGSSAYGAAPQPRPGAERAPRRTARNAETPASGTQPSRIRSMASHGLPPSRVASTAIRARYGGALLLEPTPTGWKPCRYSRHRSPAPPHAGTRAPPPSGD